MTETKWTPGPWRINRRAHLNVEADDRDGITRGVASAGGYSRPADDAVPDENAANANLIAAAPTVYDNLDATQLLLETAMVEAHKRGDGAFLERLQIQFAANRAALAKARGEQ